MGPLFFSVPQTVDDIGSGIRALRTDRRPWITWFQTGAVCYASARGRSTKKVCPRLAAFDCDAAKRRAKARTPRAWKGNALRKAVFGLMIIVAIPGATLGGGDEFGAAVKRSLDRSRALYPQSAEPDSALSKAILARIEWLRQYNHPIFADPNWPLRVTATEAAALGIRPQSPAPAVSPGTSRRFLAVATSNFSIAEGSFRKGQQFVLESVRDYGKRGTTVINGQTVLLWLDNVKILREIARDEVPPVVVKIESAHYGVPGAQAYNVTGMVQSLITPDASGRYEIFVSDALLGSSAARRLKRSTSSAINPVAGQEPLSQADRVLTVTYILRDFTRTKQAAGGETLVLD